MDQALREVADQAVEDVSEVLTEIETEPTAVRNESVAKISPALEMARAAAERKAARQEQTPEPKARAWSRDLMMVIRRSHLYAGLLLYPWVLLYGITAFLFNHPTFFSDQTFIQFGPEHMNGTSIKSLPTPADLAAKVVAAINAQSQSDGGTAYTLVKPEAARFDRGGLSATVQSGDGKSYSVTLDHEGGLVRPLAQGASGSPGGGNSGGPAEKSEAARKRRGPTGDAPESGPDAKPGLRREREVSEKGERRADGPEAKGEGDRPRQGAETKGSAPRGRGTPGGEGGERGGGPPAPFATAGLTVEGLPLEAIRESLPTILDRIGLADSTVSDVRAAPLSFQIEGEGQTWLASFNALTGSLSGRPIDDAASQAELSTRRFLLRLHMIHGYPSEFGQRWIWAFIVDLMAFLMVFWGVSGIIMWWQIKRTRTIGAAALIASTTAAAWIGIGMHNHFLNGGR